MILYDKTLDEFIELIDVQVNSWMVQNGLSRNQYQGNAVESNVTIKLDSIHLEWVQNWISEIWSDSGHSRQSIDYKREIFITNKVDMKFVRAYPKSYNYDGRTIELEFSCDYHEIGGNFSELKQIYRDKKIDQILN